MAHINILKTNITIEYLKNIKYKIFKIKIRLKLEEKCDKSYIQLDNMIKSVKNSSLPFTNYR